MDLGHPNAAAGGGQHWGRHHGDPELDSSSSSDCLLEQQSLNTVMSWRLDQKSVSQPELSSGGGSSLSSGKLSKLLVSVGDET